MVKVGDLVRVYRHGAIGIVADIFDDLDPKNPWARVIFTHPKQSYQWCKVHGLEVIKKGDPKDPLCDDKLTGSL